MAKETQSKTPKFDGLIDTVLENLAPHERVCKWQGEHPHCEGKFNITSEDIQFLNMFRVPPPNFCPTCRRMRRLVHMGVYQFFKSTCDAPQHKESIISILSEECPFPVYDYKYFIGDEFDPFAFGREHRKGESPLQELFEMRKIFPMPSFLNRDPSSINSEYSNGGRNTKNGYYAFGCYGSEDIWYSNMAGSSKEIMDSSYIYKSDHIYNGFHIENTYKSSFVYFSKDCTDSFFLFDCRNCIQCFGCVNLRNGKYCVWNKQLSKEEYENFIESLYPISREKLLQYQEKFWALVKSLPMNASRNIATEDVHGVLLTNVKNASDITNSENSEHVRHVDGTLSHKDSMDVLYSGGNSSVLYTTTNIGSQSSNVKFSVSSKFCTNSEFIFNSKNLDNCFMCFGLQSKSYCVCNKQYSPEEYFPLIDDIKSEMLKKGEYGDGVGMEFSAQAYNFSLAQVSFPLTNIEITKLGGYIVKDPETNARDIKILSVEEVPKTIEETRDDIIDSAIRCELSGRPFRIIESELQFLRKMRFPIPTVHPSIRLQNYLKMIPLGKSYETVCAKCGTSIQSLFNPQDRYILYCEKCYRHEVY